MFIKRISVSGSVEQCQKHYFTKLKTGIEASKILDNTNNFSAYKIKTWYLT